MLVDNIKVELYAITKPTNITIDLGVYIPQFPIITIDRDSYIVRAEVRSGLSFDTKFGIHSIQIGRYCSLGKDTKFMVNMNHDYSSVTTSASSFLKGFQIESKIPKKGQILIQNDVWVGYGATLMGGITLHNGSVVATNAVVTKSVPPYAIVGGNPAKIIKYRFEEQQIESMQKIAWWYWDDAKLERNKESFALPINEFIEMHEKEAIKDQEIPDINIKKDKLTYLFIPDFDDLNPVYERVIRSYCSVFGNNPNVRLLLYLVEGIAVDKNIATLRALFNNCYSGNGDILIHVDNLKDERPLFAVSDYFITSRSFETIRRTCIAEQFGVVSISGVDEPIFR